MQHACSPLAPKKGKKDERAMEEGERALPTRAGLGRVVSREDAGVQVSREDEVILQLLGCSSCPRCCGSAGKERSRVGTRAVVLEAQGTEMSLWASSLCHSPGWVAASSSGHV